MSPEVVFAPEAEEQLVDLYRYIAVADSPEAADSYTDSIVAFCEELALFPNRGKARDDIRPGLRTIGSSPSARPTFVYRCKWLRRNDLGSGDCRTTPPVPARR